MQEYNMTVQQSAHDMVQVLHDVMDQVCDSMSVVEVADQGK